MASEQDLESEVIVDVPEDEPTDVVETPDGGALITLAEEEEPGESDFYKNLAEEMTEAELRDISSKLLDLIEKDEKARAKRDEQYEEGLRRTGLGQDAPGGAQFSGASRVVHPIMAEACVDFSASAMKELFPPDGPVRIKNFGAETTQQEADRAIRVKAHMNWQLTEQIPEYRGELEQLLTQLPLGGSQYLKFYWIAEEERPGVEFLPIDDVFVPFSATNFYTAVRQTHRQYLDRYTFEDRVSSGQYRDIEVSDPSQEPEQSKSSKANDKIEGREQSSYNEDGLRTVYEVWTKLELDDDEQLSPYIVTIDYASSKVLSIYRNWREGDEQRKKLDAIVEFPFIPWRGAYAIGLPHLIGGLSAAATGALRALLDSAHINNAPTLLKLKGARMGGQSQEVAITQVQEIEGPGTVDDIRKLAMPMPFNPPSTVLYELLGWLTAAAKGVVSTAEEKIADASNSMPVGTTLALIEQGSKVFSSIHARLHAAQKKCFEILSRLNAMYLEEKDQYIEGEVIHREDYAGNIGKSVCPVSDPNIFSETQRMAQVQAIAGRAAAMPTLYNVIEVERRLLQMMRVPEADKLLQAPPEAKRMNAANENAALMLGRPASAFPEQDHIAHIATHLDFIQNPTLGGNQFVLPRMFPLLIEHLKQHISFYYVKLTYDVVTEAADGRDLTPMLRSTDPSEMDRLIALASQAVNTVAAEQLGKMEPAISAALALIQQLMPPQEDTQLIAAKAMVQDVELRYKAAQEQHIMDLKQAEMEATAKMQQIQSQHTADMTELQTRSEQATVESAAKIAELQVKHQQEMARLQSEKEDAHKKLQVQMMTATLDADTKRQIAVLDAHVKLLLEQSKQDAAARSEAMQVALKTSEALSGVDGVVGQEVPGVGD